MDAGLNIDAVACKLFYQDPEGKEGIYEINSRMSSLRSSDRCLKLGYGVESCLLDSAF